MEASVHVQALYSVQIILFLVSMYIQSDFSNALHLQPKLAHKSVHIRKRCYNVIRRIDIMSTTWMVSTELYPLLADQIPMVCKAIVCF
jgi:hypothetical protein